MFVSSAPQSHFVRQRTDDDCGCASLAILLKLEYEAVQKAWVTALGRPPSRSSYADLISVGSQLGYIFKRGRTKNGIRRIRPVPGTRESHWVVLLGEWIYCPTSGIYYKDHYPWKAWGDGLEVHAIREVIEKPSTTD